MLLSAVLGMLRHSHRSEEVLRNAVRMAAGGLDSGGKLLDGASWQVAEWCRAIALSLNLPSEQVHSAWAAGMLHRLPQFPIASTQGRPGGVSHGAVPKGTEGADDVRRVLEAIDHQDERHNGTGSPGGKKGEEIPLLGRILAFAKYLNELSGQAGAENLAQALEKIRPMTGNEFHPDVVQACLLAQRHGLLAGEAGKNVKMFSQIL